MNKWRKIIIFFGLMLLMWAHNASAATIALSPGAEAGVYDVFLNLEENESINAVEGTILFDENIKTIPTLVVADSIVSLWAKQPTVSGSSITFAGIIPGGFSVLYDQFGGKPVRQGRLFSIVFPFTKNVKAYTFTLDSVALYLNDGRGTPSTFPSSSITLPVSGDKNDFGAEQNDEKSSGVSAAVILGVAVILLLVLSIIFRKKTRIMSVFLILFLGYFGHFMTASAETKAVLFFGVPMKVVTKGDKITIQIKVNSGDQSINAVSGSFQIPAKFRLESIDLSGSILDFWAREPKVGETISFEGVALKNPYKGASGLVFSMKGTAVSTGTTAFSFDDGSILADDGKGTNVLGELRSASYTVEDSKASAAPAAEEVNDHENIAVPTQAIQIIPPVIIESSPPTMQSESFSLTGKGTPNALTKIEFQDVSDPSLGRNLILSFKKDRVPLTDVELLNDPEGIFSYVSPTNLVAGVYNAVPSYVSFDKAKTAIGYGVKVFVTDNTLSQVLIVIINALVLVIPIMALILLIIFMPWYYKKRLHVMTKKMELEEQRITAEEHKILEGDRNKIRRI